MYKQYTHSINKMNFKFALGFITAILCVLSVFFASGVFINSKIANAETTAHIQAQKNSETDFYLVGTFTNWEIIADDAHLLKYDKDIDCYCGHVHYEGTGTCEWKVIRGHDWNSSWGGTIEYTTDKATQKQVGQCVGLMGNKNLNPPNVGSTDFDVKVKVTNYNNSIIAVNKIPDYESTPEISVTLWDENRKVNGHVDKKDESTLSAHGWIKKTVYNQTAGQKVDTWTLKVQGQPKTETEYMDIWNSVSIHASETAEDMVFVGFKPNVKNEIVLLSIQFHAKYELVYKPSKENKLEIFGEFNNWGNPKEEGADPLPGVGMEYDEANNWYFAELDTARYGYDFKGQFKIRKPNDSRFNRGGNTIYIDAQQAIAAAQPYGDNYSFPKDASTYKIWLTTKDGNFDKVFVNNQPPKAGQALKNLHLATDDESLTFKYSIDNCMQIETSEVNLCLPQDVDMVVAQNPIQIESVPTMTLKFISSASGQNHECTFTYMPKWKDEVIPLSRIRYAYGSDNSIADITFYLSQLPANVQIVSASNQKFQYAIPGENIHWTPVLSVICDTYANACDLSILDNPSGEYVCISDGKLCNVYVKEIAGAKKLSAQNIIYDKANGFVYTDYQKPQNPDMPNTADGTGIVFAILAMFALAGIGNLLFRKQGNGYNGKYEKK